MSVNKHRFLRFLRAIPVRWRLSLGFLGLFILLLSILGIILPLVAEQTLVTNEVNVLRTEAQVAFKGVTRDLHTPSQRPFLLESSFFPSARPPANFGTTALPLLRALSSPGTSAVILTPAGTQLMTYQLSLFDLPPLDLPASQVQRVIQSGSPYLLTRNGSGPRQLVVFISLVKNFHTLAILQISTPTTSLDNFLATFRLLLLLSSCCAFVIAVALIFPLVSMALRPLVNIERTSRRIARGELSLRLDPPPTDDEIGRLARTFNAMVGQLETALQKQKRFVSDVSHELRTPLTVLSGNLEMLLLGVHENDPEKNRRLTRGLFTEVQRMHRLVEDLLVLTRLDGERLPLRRSPLLIEALLSTICQQIAHLAHGQKIECQIEPGLPMLYVDRDRLQQALLNLVDNALKYTPSDGSIELRVWNTPLREIALSVSDTGCGISPADLPHVFDRFYRADRARSHTSGQSGGNGLGLAIAKDLVEAQGGHIDISSTPGQGTCVTLSFPASLQCQEQSSRKAEGAMS